VIQRVVWDNGGQQSATEAWRDLGGVSVTRMIAGLVYNNTGIQTTDVTETYVQAMGMSLPFNSSDLEVKAVATYCPTWWHIHCIDTPVQLVPCAVYDPYLGRYRAQDDVKAAYMADADECAATQCKEHLELMLSLPNSMCVNPDSPITINSKNAALRLYVTSPGTLDLDLVELVLAFPHERYRVSKDTRSLLRPRLSWMTFPFALQNGKLGTTRVNLRRQDVTMLEFPWNTNSRRETYVNMDIAPQPVNIRSNQQISLDQEQSCPLDVPRGTCAFLVDIWQNKVADDITIDHKSLFSLIAEVGGILSLVMALGKLSIGTFNRREFRKWFLNTYGTAWAETQSQLASQPERDTVMQRELKAGRQPERRRTRLHVGDIICH